jgi:regulator of protease activity HflC (stomatin/prohibitin superfamily)
MKKATWIVKAYTGYKTGWQEIKSFSSPAAADEWLCNYVRANGYSITDFNIIDFDFSDAFITAIEEKQVAQQQLVTKRVMAQAKAEAEAALEGRPADIHVVRQERKKRPRKKS